MYSDSHPIHLAGNCWSKNMRTMLTKCGVALSCWYIVPSGSLRHNIQLQHIQVRVCSDSLLSTPDIFLWGFVKDQVYRALVYDLADLEERIYAAVNNVTRQKLHNTWDEVEYRLGISLVANGSHVEVYGT